MGGATAIMRPFRKRRFNHRLLKESPSRFTDTTAVT